MQQLASHTDGFAAAGSEGEEGVLLHDRVQPEASERVVAKAEPGSRLVGRAGWLLIVCGLVLLPWLYVLATGLPDTATATQWPVAWVGLDALEAVGLITTGVLTARGDRRHALAATAAATLLVIDAWFDTTTAAAGSDLVTAAAMALCAELPLAALCAWLAARAPGQRA
ncbi:hypothetical protein [Streptomyces sp. PpalLS-921]|uniref:hypothetical protein n=1 Tax=Streptomyces sp. PpalLS-921 TaxID=1839772 RepID=UPI00081D7739|nr:hypothetical protein [Streptomyces sp. PpalLS-921]SCE07620.1 hypothetical protein GA0115249_112845 [Streptomyces sp. PpalLS-921]